MLDLRIALAIHVISVIWWIGGLAMVTTVFLPGLRQGFHPDPGGALAYIERHFAPQARVAVLLVGVSGAYMLTRLHAWSWLRMGRFWWVDAMLGYWLLFAVMLFVLEPLGAHGWMKRQAATDSGRLRRMQRVHALMLALGLVVVMGAVLGNHRF
ncbi:MAG TPA: hypothetical protein VLV87_03255 [Gammaproteobacteria bacterium]|nr:hypothetical protein [Gammaproteobacteria bacterium]